MSEPVSLVARVVVCFVALAMGACTASNARPTPSPPSIPLQIEVVQEGLSLPWDLAFSPDGRMFVTERRGRIQVYASGAPGAELLQTVDVPDVRAVGESGVMGVAVDREFDAYPFLYVCASRDADGEEGGAPWLNELLRFRVTDDGLEFEGPVFDSTIIANRQHDGCAVEMDAEGHLWMSTGDALGPIPGTPQLDTLNGKVLRMNRDGSIPDDNPVTFDDQPGYVYSLGHRNPQGLAIEPGTGRSTPSSTARPVTTRSTASNPAATRLAMLCRRRRHPRRAWGTRSPGNRLRAAGRLPSGSMGIRGFHDCNLGPCLRVG